MVLVSCGAGKASSGFASSSSSPSFSASSSSSLPKDDPTKKYGLTLKFKPGYRILWLTDLHFGNPTNTATYDETVEYAHLRAMIE